MVFESPAHELTFLQLLCRFWQCVHFITHSKRNFCHMQELNIKQQVTNYSKQQDYHHQVIVKSDEDQIGDGGEDPSVSFEINNSSFVDEEDSEDDSVEEVPH